MKQRDRIPFVLTDTDGLLQTPVALAAGESGATHFATD